MLFYSSFSTVLLLTSIHVFLDLFFSSVSLFFPFLHLFVSESIRSTSLPTSQCDFAPPAAQDFGGVGFWGGLSFWQALPIILIPIKWEIFIFEADLQACLPPLPWLFKFLTCSTDLYCLGKETQENVARTKLQGFLAAKPTLVRNIEF